MKTKRFKVIFIVGLVVVVMMVVGLLFPPALLLSFSGTTTSEQAKRISPDDRYVASQIFRDGGATDGAEWIALRDAGKPIDANEAGAVFYISSRMRNISFYWAGPKTVIIRYEDLSVPSDPDFAYYKSWPRLDHWQDVHVIFQKAAMKSKPV